MNTAPTHSPPPSPEVARPVFSRLPILDRAGRVAGWNLVDLEAGGEAATHPVIEDIRAQQADAAPRPTFLVIRCDARKVMAGRLDLAAGVQVVLDIQLPPVAADEVAEALSRVLTRLHRQGVRFAFSSTVLASAWRPCLALASFVRLDVAGVPPAALQAMMKAARSVPQLQLIAAGVATPEIHLRALAMGFDLFLGSWFMLPRPAPARARAGQLTPLELIAALMHDAPTSEIEEILKRDPLLSFNLMRFVNSSGLGLSCEITSFRHAVMIVGREKLLRWCCLLVAVHDKSQCPGLSQLAVVRGRFMEKLVHEHGDHAFITGLFSLLEVMTGQAIGTALARLPLPETVGDALLRREGVLAPLLELAKEYERGDTEALEARLEELHVSHEQARTAFQAAVAWSANMMG
jgi:c-di-GMP-related signal transduction protein